MKIKLYIIVGLALACLNSCDKFLDELPDKRATIDTPQKAQDVLVSAYPIVDPMMIYEHRTDNAMDNGENYGVPDSRMIIENYKWKDVSETDWDAPEQLWSSCYKAIATANVALEALDEMEGDNNAIKGEAYLCRAYAHFLLANTFCEPYSPNTAAQNQGIPYVRIPETVIGKKYDRGTLEETYANLEKDIEQGIKLVDDNIYSVPLYHFTKKAAAAFAARFYLYYRKYDKALEYANMVLPEDPSAVLRDINANYTTLSSIEEWRDRFITKDEIANVLLVPLRSLWGRFFTTRRYGNSEQKAIKETYRSPGPWGRLLGAFDLLFGANSYGVVFQPKYYEIFEITNITAQTGQPHTVQMAFTTDETLLVRAEAKILLKQYEDAAKDLSYWYVKKGGKACDVNEIVNYYQNLRDKEKADLASGDLQPWLQSIKPFHTDFEIEPTTQEPMLQAVLHARRIETMYSGLRWLDIRRYGIEVVHNIDGGKPITLKYDDKRRTIQIPASVIAAGLPENPRNSTN